MKLYWLLLLFPIICFANDVQFLTEDLPPFQIVDSKGSLIGGSSYIVIRELAKRAGVKADFLVMPWARAYKTTLNRPNTFIYSIARSPQREPLFIWVGEIRRVKYHFYSLKSDAEHISLANKDVFLRNVAVVRDTIEEDLLKQVGFEEGKNLILTDSHYAAFNMVIKKRVDSVYGNIHATKGVSRFLDYEKFPFIASATLNQSLDFYLAANQRSDPALIARLMDEFSRMKSNGLIDQIIEQQEQKIFAPEN